LELFNYLKLFLLFLFLQTLALPSIRMLLKRRNRRSILIKPDSVINNKRQFIWWGENTAVEQEISSTNTMGDYLRPISLTSINVVFEGKKYLHKEYRVQNNISKIWETIFFFHLLYWCRCEVLCFSFSQ